MGNTSQNEKQRQSQQWIQEIEARDPQTQRQPLKWVGGKTQTMDNMISNVQQKWTVTTSCSSEEAEMYAYDVNKKLIQVYKQIKNT